MKAITQHESVVTYIRSCLISQIPRFMLISKYRVISPLSKNCNSLKMNYQIGKNQLEVTNCEKYLGIFISDDLSLEKHVQSIVSSSCQKLCLINRVFYQCSPNIQEKLYNHLVRSKLEYYCTVWDPNQIGLISLLEKFQKKGAHIVLGSNFETYEKALSDL